MPGLITNWYQELYNLKKNHSSAGGDAWSHYGHFRQYEAKRHKIPTREISSHRSPKTFEKLILICIFLMNVTHQILTKLLRPVTYSLKFTYHMCFHRTSTIATIQTYGVWFYEMYMKATFEKIEEQLIRYSHGFFFPEKFYTHGFIFYVLEVFLNLAGMFSLVFVLAMAFYPIITFLSVVIVLFILFQTIVNQGIVNYYYYFSNNKK